MRPSFCCHLTTRFVPTSTKCGETEMRKHLAAVVLVGSMMAGVSAADAKGCIRGAIAGGVAGHYAHHHAVAGAMAGCVAGHYYYKHKAAAKKPAAAHAR
jgi:hypothetical protein